MRGRTGKVGGDLFGPLDPPQSSVSPGSEFWESDPKRKIANGVIISKVIVLKKKKKKNVAV